jgi:hypothetical protein
MTVDDVGPGMDGPDEVEGGCVAGSDLTLEGAGLALEVLEVGPAGQTELGHDGLLSTVRLVSAWSGWEGVP